MTIPHASVRLFTGRHMALIMVTFFCVVVTVNMTMAFLATQSWTGLVVPNAYVASQHFNKETTRREAMLQRGDRLKLDYERGRISIAVQDKTGHPIQLDGVKLKFYRSVAARPDAPLVFTCNGVNCAAAVELTPGNWSGELTIELPGQKPLIQAVEILVKEK